MLMATISFTVYCSDIAKAEVESKQKTYASHEDAKQAFKDLLREKVHVLSAFCNGNSIHNLNYCGSRCVCVHPRLLKTIHVK